MSIIIESIKILYFLFRPFKKLILIYACAVVLLSSLEVFRVSLVYPIINYGLGVENQPKLLDAFYDYLLPSSVNPFIASAFLLLLTTIIIAGAYGVVAYSGAYLFSMVRDSIDRRVFDKIQRRPYSYFAGKKQGDLLYIGHGAVDISSGAVNVIVELVRNSVMAFFYLLLLFYLSFWLTVGVIILGIFYAYLVKRSLLSRVYRNSNILKVSFMEKTVVYQEFISGIKTIFITGSLEFWKQKYNFAIKRVKKAQLNVNALGKIPSIANDFILFLIIALGGILLYIFTNGDFIPYIGIFGTFMLALYRLVPSLTGAQSNIAALVQCLPALELVYETINSEDEDDLSKEVGGKNKFSFSDSIELKNISFRYDEDTNDVIRNLSIHIFRNTKVAIVGGSGSGKTTIANLLACLYKPTSGGIYIDGVNLNEISSDDYIRSLGYIGQETFVYHDTIKENIRFGQNCTDEDIITAAKLADAHDFIIQTSNGYDTIIGDQGLKLSGGQRQRIAIARIILKNPQILLLDEATSSLDNISEKRITEAIQQLAENMTVITIAHRLSTIQNADVIYVLRDGQIAESGSHEELLEMRGEYYRLYLGQGNQLAGVES